MSARKVVAELTDFFSARAEADPAKMARHVVARMLPENKRALLN